MTMRIEDVITVHEGEKIVAQYRNHALSHLRGWTVSVLLLALPFFLMMPLFSRGQVGVAAFLVLVLVGVWAFARNYVVWKNSVLLVTSERVVDVDQRGLFSRTVSEAAFDKVQDVSYSVRGMLGTVMRCGSVTIQTAGTSPNLEMEFVHGPKDVQSEIVAAMSGVSMAGNGSGKMGSLLEATDDLSSTEAKAMLVALKEKISEKEGENPKPRKVSDEDLAWYREDEEV